MELTTELMMELLEPMEELELEPMDELELGGFCARRC